MRPPLEVIAPMDPTVLAGRLGFSVEELALNRTGRASPAQLARLQRDRKRGRWWLVFVALFAVAFVAVAASIMIAQLKDHGDKSSSSVPVVPIVIGVLAFVVLLVTLSLVRSRRSLDRIASGDVHQVTGPAHGRVRRMHGNVADPSAPGSGTSGSLRYELTIGDVRFFVAGRGVLDAFADGAGYRAYYVAGGNRVMNILLSAEAVR
jgi:cytochrome c-type biogenesis protein CcmE